MGYKRADEVLPEYMLKILQEYAGGELLYVPKKERDRKRWGTGTGMGERLRLQKVRAAGDARRGGDGRLEN